MKVNMDKIFFHKNGFFDMSTVQDVTYLNSDHEVVDIGKVVMGDILGSLGNTLPTIEYYNKFLREGQEKSKIAYFYVTITQGRFILLDLQDSEKFLRFVHSISTKEMG